MKEYFGKKYIDNIKDIKKNEKDNTKYVYKDDLPENTRIIDKDTFVTMDYNKDRLNLFVDNDYIVINAIKG